MLSVVFTFSGLLLLFLHQQQQHPSPVIPLQRKSPPTKHTKAKPPSFPRESKLQLLNKVFSPPPPRFGYLANLKYFFTKPLAKLVTRKHLQHKYKLYYQRNDSLSLFEYYNPKYQPYRALFALDDAEALSLSNHYYEIAPAHQTTMPRSQMELVLDKARFSTWLEENGFADHVPKRYENVDTVVSFPVVVKLPVGSTSSLGVFVVHNRTDLHNVSLRLTNQSYFIQEYIQGSKERVVHVVAIHGRLVRMVCHERDLDDALIYQFISDPNKWRKTPPSIPLEQCHLPLFTQIVSTLNFTGIGNFDVKVASPFVVKIFEFNPRVPGTILRDARLMGEFFCAMQWEGNGILSENGCIYSTKIVTTLL